MSEARVPITVVMGSSGGAKAEAVLAIGGSRPAEVTVVASAPIAAAGIARVVEVPECIAERSLGCPCCAIRLDVRSAVCRLVARRRPPGRIIVVADVDADPGPLLATLLCDLHLARRTKVESVVAVVDGPQAAVRLATHQPLLPGAAAEAHLAVADAVVVLGGRRLTAAARRQIADWLTRANPYIPMELDEVSPGSGWVPAAGAYDLAAVAIRLDALSPGAPPTSAVALVDVEGEGDPEGLRAWARDVFRDQGGRLLRLQAVCSLRGQRERWACSAVRSFYATGSCGPAPTGPPRARVLAIGRDLNVAALSGTLHRILTAGG